MIFVTVGTNEARFDRLLRALDGLGDGEELVVQRGPSPVQPRGAACVDFLSFGEMIETLRRARVVVAHAGVGSIMTALLLAGKRPLVVPRLRCHGEAVDDHQLQFGRRLEQEGLVILVEDPALLPELIRQPSVDFERQLQPDRRLVVELRDLIGSAIDRTTLPSGLPSRSALH